MPYITYALVGVVIRVLRSDNNSEDEAHAMNPPTDKYISIPGLQANLVKDVLDILELYNPSMILFYGTCNGKIFGFITSVEYTLSTVYKLRPYAILIAAKNTNNIYELRSIPLEHVLYAEIEKHKLVFLFKCINWKECNTSLNEYMKLLHCRHSELRYYIVATELEELIDEISKRLGEIT